MKLSFLFLVVVAVGADVSELASQKYLPPAADTSVTYDAYQEPSKTLRVQHNQPQATENFEEYLPPVETHTSSQSHFTSTHDQNNQPDHVLADDGYQYRTPSLEKLTSHQEAENIQKYLPPTEIQSKIASVQVQNDQPAHVLTDDGYQYRTIRKLKYRNRRDVSELTATKYLAPSAKASVTNIAPLPAADPVQTYLSPKQNLPSSRSNFDNVYVQNDQHANFPVDDGYQYKTPFAKNSALKDMEQLSPLTAAKPDEKYLSPKDFLPVSRSDFASFQVQNDQPAHVLADDGYQYRTIRKLKYRNRRDVSELSSTKYLPPSATPKKVHSMEKPAPLQQTETSQNLLLTEILVPSQSNLVPVSVQNDQPAHVLADDGYQYNTPFEKASEPNMQIRHLEELAPLQVAEYSASTETLSSSSSNFDIVQVQKDQPAHVLADASEKIKEYLPPIETLSSSPSNSVSVQTQNDQHAQTQGDATEQINEYLPPIEASASSKTSSISAPSQNDEPAHVLADDGYQYRTIRKLKYRHRV